MRRHSNRPAVPPTGAQRALQGRGRAVAPAVFCRGPVSGPEGPLASDIASPLGTPVPAPRTGFSSRSQAEQLARTRLYLNSRALEPRPSVRYICVSGRCNPCLPIRRSRKCRCAANPGIPCRARGRPRRTALDGERVLPWLNPSATTDTILGQDQPPWNPAPAGWRSSILVGSGAANQKGRAPEKFPGRPVPNPPSFTQRQKSAR